VRAPILQTLAGAFALFAVVGLIALRPTGHHRPEVQALSSFEGVYPAKVERLTEGSCRGGDPSTRCVTARFGLLAGPDAGSPVTVELPASGRTASLGVGASVLLGHQPDVPGFEYVYLDPDRRSPLLTLTAVFAAAVILMGRWRGLSALVGLLATLLVLFLFVVPAILDGRDPLAVSLVGSVLIAFAALYLSHGADVQTTVALLGTIGGLLCAAILAVLFMRLAHITGLASEEALFITALGTNIDLRGLILGGMMIGALGAIDDMTVTQSAAVWELRAADPSMSARHLHRAGMRIGRDHVASTVNTLVLAYAGASMPVLVLFVLSGQPAWTVASGEIVATEIVRTLVGSIGLVASVPITTWLAARTVSVRAGRHARVAAPSIEAAIAAPEEHPIPDRRRDVWVRWLRERRPTSM
jgi:uncharacterized membrane protein